jgi:Kef-type K+ transport system membrane component KefB
MHEHLDVYQIFLMLAVILLTAQVFGLVFKRLGIPAVLGEVSAGIVLGPSLLGIVEFNDAIKVLAEIGIILLLFQVGLEVDFKGLVRSGLWAAVVALVGALLPFAGGFAVAHYLFHLPVATSLFIGGALTATSIGITIRVLSDLGKDKERFAQIVLGAAVLDDVLGVILLTAVYEFARSGGFEPASTARLAFFIVFFLVVAPFVTQVVAKLLFLVVEFFNREEARKVRKLSPEEISKEEIAVIPPVVMSIVLGASYLAHKFGSPSILGTFTAGLALSENFPVAKMFQLKKVIIEKIEETVFVLVWIFGPIFFVGVGLAINLREIDFSSPEFWLLSLSLLAVAIVGKVAAGFFVRGVSLKEKTIIGFSMLPRGEVGLIFAEFGRAMGVINPTEYAVVVFVVAITTLIAPIALKLLLKS